MKRALPFLLIALVAVFWIRAVDFGMAFVNPCDGPTIKQNRKISSFSKIDAGSIFQIEYRHSSTTACEIEGVEEHVKLVRTEVRGGVLYLSLSGSIHNSTEGIKVRLTGPEFRGADISGAAQLTTYTGFPSTPVELGVSGAAQYEGDLNSPDLTADLNGAAQVNLRGTATKMKATICGAAQLDAPDFAADDLRITLSGAGQASLRVNRILNAVASGASQLTYSGNPSKVSRSTDGASSIVKL